MLQYSFKLCFMLYIITQFSNNSINACSILPCVAQENEFIEVEDVSNIITSTAHENRTTEVTGAPNILYGISKENETIEVVTASNLLPDTSQENRTAEVVDTPNMLPKIKFESLARSCYDLQKLGGVCKDENETIIEPDPVSSVKEIYELTFNDTKYLPARVLSGFSVHFLILDDPDVTVDKDLLDGIVQLEEFIVRQSSIKAIPDFKFVKDTIEGISIQSSLLTSLEGKNLQNLTRIKDMVFKNNFISFIDPDVFKGTENVFILDLSRNRLTSIPPNLLDPMKNLTGFFADHNNLLHVDNLFSRMNSLQGTENVFILDLSRNRLTSIPPNLLDPMKNLTGFFADHNNLLHVDNLFSRMNSLQFIELSHNNITDVESVLQASMKSVEDLYLSGNPIQNLTVNSFYGKVDKVKVLFLSQCQLQKFSLEYFHELDDLSTLDLSNNLIEEDSDAYSEKFDNKNEGKIAIELYMLNLVGNKLKSISKILKYKQIERLQVAKNQIQYLSDEDFRFVHETQHLELQENQIRRIDRDTFQHIKKSLNHLDLSFNSISSLNRSIRYLSQLRTLNLANNLIRSFARDEFTGLYELSDLYLQHNRIKALGEFHHLPDLKYLNLTDNDIEHIRADQVPKNLEEMDLAGNNLKCDCSLQPFLHRLKTQDSIKIDIDLCPKSDVGSRLNKNSNCPSMCSCGCTNYGDVYFMFVDCSSKDLSVVPQFLRGSFPRTEGNATRTSDDRSGLVMKDNIYPLFDLEDRVLGINLENNSLESLEGLQLPPDLIQLYLANNKLRRLPDSILKNQRNLKNVSLSGNPWKCDCDALTFKAWLNSLRHEKIQDIEKVRCRVSGKGESALNGKVIWTLTDYDLCPKDVDLIVSGSFGILTVVIVCLATILLFKKYELHIKVFLYSRGFTFVKEKDLDYDKVFDAFLSFCHQDDKFVAEEIISVIEEKDPNIRLCIHYRHFMAGEYIYDNIIWAVQNSKRTVLILTKNFLESEWCLMEFRTAHTQALEDKVHRIIVVKVGDLPKEMDPAIKAYLDSTTYLTWGEKQFWNKLLYVLPSGSSVRKSLQEI